MSHLTGLSAFPITPADPAGTVDTSSLRVLVGRLVAAGVDSIGVLGSTGTYAYLSRAERRRALDATLAEAGRTPVLAGIGAMRTDEAVNLAKDARAAGAFAGLLAPVSYTPLNDDEVFEHFSTVARESGLPICIYDNPGTTHFRFSSALVGRLSRVPGIVAVKCPPPAPGDAARHLEEMRGAVRPGFEIGYSGDWIAAEALIAGGAAWYSVLGGIMPKICLQLVRAAQAGNAEQARSIDARLEPMWALFKAHTSLRVVYAIARLRGLVQADPPRPILPLPPAALTQVTAFIEAHPDLA